jgi:hypothetical protein
MGTLRTDVSNYNATGQGQGEENRVPVGVPPAALSGHAVCHFLCYSRKAADIQRRFPMRLFALLVLLAVIGAVVAFASQNQQDVTLTIFRWHFAKIV